MPVEQDFLPLVIARIEGSLIADSRYRDSLFSLTRQGIAGFIIFAAEREFVRPLIRELQDAAELPLFIASDIERGTAQQFRGGTPFPPQMGIAAGSDPATEEGSRLLDEALRAIAEEARDIGINMPLIPVLDVNINPANPIICTRAFSDDPETVSRLGVRYVEIMNSEGMISCCKHFPGHGDTSTDSHISLPVIRKSLHDLMECDIVPFARAVKAGVPAVMTGHIRIPAIDEKPASMSRTIIGKILRERLGFRGLVLTDALNMGALAGTDDIPAACLNAGADILLHPGDALQTVRSLGTAVLEKRLSETTVTAALERTASYRKNLALQHQIGGTKDEWEHISDTLFAQSVTLVKGAHGILPVSETRQCAVIYSGDEYFYANSYMRSYFPSLDGDGVDYGTTTLLVFIYTSVAAWKGSSGIGDDQANHIRQIIKQANLSVVVSFGSPYVLSHFSDADVLIAAYDASPKAEAAVYACLTGRRPFSGRLPLVRPLIPAS